MKRFAAVLASVALVTSVGLLQGCGRSSLQPLDGLEPTDASIDQSLDGEPDVISEGGPDGMPDGPDGGHGCKTNKDCASTPSTPYCEIPPGKCVACEVPSQCPAGDTCRDFKCVPLCTDGTCAGGLSCCNDVCVNEQTDPDNCDACGNVCPNGEACTTG